MKGRIAGHESTQNVLLLLTLQDATSCLGCGHYFIHRVCERSRYTLIGGHGAVVDEISSFTSKLLLIKGENVAIKKSIVGN